MQAWTLLKGSAQAGFPCASERLCGEGETSLAYTVQVK